jgi:hypothetical protein
MPKSSLLTMLSYFSLMPKSSLLTMLSYFSFTILHFPSISLVSYFSPAITYAYNYSYLNTNVKLLLHVAHCCYTTKLIINY